MWRVGLTGGIGSGKSTVATALKARGAFVIDADHVSKKLTAAGGGAMASIQAQFGLSVVLADGAMNRDTMRALILRDADAKQRLEAIIHPLVARDTALLVATAAASGQRCVVFDIPLLVESGRWRSQLDRIIVVDCSAATQVERVTVREASRPGWTSAAVLQVIAAQASWTQRLMAADICIHNDNISLKALHQQIDQVADGFGL